MGKNILRKLGKEGPELPALGLGCMGMSEFYGPANDEESIAVLNRSIDEGCTFWDTADMYGSGANERLLAKVLEKRRDEVFLCTKFGIVRGPNNEFLGINGKPEYVKQACEASLKRLGVKTIDLYYQHRVDTTVPIEETVKAMVELKNEGKIRYLGLSESSAENIRRAHKVHPIAAYQVEFSPWTLDIENDGRLQACRELGIAIIAYSPLGRGILSGAYKSVEDFDETDFRRYNPRYAGENFQKNLDLVNGIKEIAEKKGCTPSQLALAWVLDQGDDFFTIPGTKRVKYLDENLGAADVKITPDDHKEIRSLISRITVHGDRYPNMASVNN